jgi:polygalacturonase
MPFNAKLKVLFLSLLLSNSIIQANAQYRQTPVVGNKVFDISKLGAVADGKTLNTEFIQKALDMAATSGGKVLISAGTYLCGPLTMHNKTELIINKGAILRLTNDIEKYPVINGHYGNFLEILNGADIKISGGGTIDGQGKIWWEKYDAKALVYRRPQLLYAANPTRIEISGVTFLDPPNTHISIKDGSDVYIHGIRIDAPANSHNTDGINISARDCTIEDCDISTGDDNIAVNFGGKAGAKPECENILIQNCRFGYGHGLSVGSYTSGGLRHLSVNNCAFNGTLCGVRIKTARGRGGVVEDLSYTDLTMTNVRAPFFISEYYPREPARPADDTAPATADRIPIYRNILLRNIKAAGATEAIKIWGLPESPIENIRFENVTVNAKKGGIISNARKVTFSGSSLIAQDGQAVEVFQADVTGL